MIRAGALALLLASPAAALELTLPATARLTVERNTAPDRYAAPVGVFDGGAVPTVLVEGDVRRAAWRLEAPGLTPLQVMRPLREQVEAAGYDVVLDCAAAECGGFDFRFATEVLPGPNMYVNLRAFHMLTARKGEDEVVTLLTSTSASSAYVQIIRAGAGEAGVTATLPAPDPGEEAAAPVVVSVSGDLATELVARGHVVLGDLDFGSGSAELGPGPFASLSALAAYLAAAPGVRIGLVGHTDSVGSLEANVQLSRRRAQAVRARLIEAHGVEGGRMEAQGMGYLAPVASNLEPAGRDANRRVEAILLSAE